MLIIGHPWIKSPKFVKAASEEAIKKSQANEIILLETLENSHALAQYCQENGIAYALFTDSLKEAVFANALGAKYILCEEEPALAIQVVAQEYLFDTRVLVPIENEKEIEKIAKSGIDGVIFREAILAC